ncbi:hypothetical protein FE782_01900 [Paenibacillus antri]|uniref:Uncharacterized protein n=1 Tax=Paenibacillus antri TaxID=2582848 RepID=A0A5R9GLU2_9BACL|nr:hypothetical protein [Paenibacillus antri]TLS54123.1 hypothetical protein FE782_01900 [Paenibacillus antri]
MAKSYKMVLLLYMLELGAERWAEPVTPQEVAPFFHRYLMEKEYRKRIDFSDAESRRLWTYDETAVSGFIARMPLTKWAGARGSMTRFEDGMLSLVDVPAAEHRRIVHRWTRDVCEYRLHVHFERRAGRQEL